MWADPSKVASFVAASAHWASMGSFSDMNSVMKMSSTFALLSPVPVAGDPEMDRPQHVHRGGVGCQVGDAGGGVDGGDEVQSVPFVEYSAARAIPASVP